MHSQDILLPGRPSSNSEGGRQPVVISETEREAPPATQEEGRRLARALSVAGVGTWEWTPGSGGMTVDAREAALLGCAPGDIQTLDDFLALVHADDRDGVRRALAAACAAGEAYEHVFRVVRPDGEVRWLEERGQCTYDAAGEAIGMHGVSLDVTRRKQAEDALQQRDTLLRQVSELLFDYAYSLRVLPDGSTEREWTTGNFAHVTGYTAEEYDAEGGVQGHLHPDDAATFARLYADLARDQVAVAELRIRTKEGNYRWVATRARAERDDEGHIVRVVGASTDITERKEAESALGESNARFRSLADAAPMLVWMSGTDGLCDYFNAGWLGFTGRPLEEELGNGWAEGVHPDDYAHCLDIYTASFEARTSFEMEYRLRRHDGQYRWLIDRAVPRYTPDGAFAGFIGACIDIHERRESERDVRFLASLERDLKPLSDPDAMVALTARVLGEHLGVDRCLYALVEDDGDHLDIRGDYGGTGAAGGGGRYALSYFGDEALGLLRTNEPHVICDLESEASDGMNLSAYRQMGIQASICVPLHRGGRTVATLSVYQSAPRRWTAGEIDLIRTVAGRTWESLERARAEAALRESEAHFRLLAEAMPGIMYATDAAGRVDYVNGRWFAYTGQEPGADAVRVTDTYLHPDDRMRIAGIRVAARQAEEGFEFEVRMRRHDGAYRWFLTRVVPVHDAGGRLVRWFGTSTDIHAQKALEAELESHVAARTNELARANQALEVRNRELQEFAYAASHDLQEPLRKIRTFADLLEADFGSELAEEARHYVGRMQDAAGRMSVLISDLLAFSRVSTRGQDFAPVDLHAVTQAVLSDLEVAVREAGGEVEVDALPVVEADPTQMRQLVQNLVGNALKYRRDGVPPRIRVRGTLEADAVRPRVRIRVEDNGIGFEEKYTDRIFAPFQRLHGRGQYEGTGIGLAICRKIVERHGGTITARSTVGEGSAFEVTLPVLQPETSSTGASEGSA